MDKRYQVFVSSTFADLKEERRGVIQTLMEMDCIPAGMELFPAMDEEQWAFIRKVIDDCDYYLLVIGGRYGSTTADGVSYTEKEYDYAVARGIRVIALLHEHPDDIAVAKSEMDPVGRKRLGLFRDKAATGRLVRFWSRAEELPGLVALSLSKTIKTYPAIGWVRASTVSNEDLVTQMLELRERNDALRAELDQIQALPAPSARELASLDEKFQVHGTYSHRNFKGEWKTEASWRDMFGLISPSLLEHPADSAVKNLLALALQKNPGDHVTFRMNNQEFQTITLQFKALGLVKITYSKSTAGTMHLFWQLTAAGEELMMQLRTISPG